MSDNAYHLSTLLNLGRRFTPSARLLEAVVIKRPADVPAPPDLIPRLLDELRQQGTAGVPAAGVVTW